MGDRSLFKVDFATEGMLWVRGPSGVGKSQLLRAVAGLVPHDGDVFLHGEARGLLPAWRARVAMVPQEPPADDGTGEQWRGWVGDLTSQRDREADDPVGLAEAWGLPAERWDQPLSRLSGGERQRLWLALVLSRRPEAVLLDEPTSALDPVARDAVVESLRGRLGVLVTHDQRVGEALSTDVLELS